MAPPRAKAIGATAMQIFTKMANRWAERECEPVEVEAFRSALRDTEVRVISAHDSYLINLASPDPVLRARSLESFECELRRCTALSLDFLVSHPGNYMDDRASGLARNADAITRALEKVPGKTMLLMETTAGSGTALGSTFEEMAKLIRLVAAPQRKRVGVCVDTHYDRVQSPVPPTWFGVLPQAEEVGPMTIDVRTAASVSAILPLVREAVRTVDKDLPVFDVRTQLQQIDSTMSRERLFMALTSTFGVLALVLASVGIYGSLAQNVSRRTGEVGIRVARGAGRADVLVMGCARRRYWPWLAWSSASASPPVSNGLSKRCCTVSHQRIRSRSVARWPRW